MNKFYILARISYNGKSISKFLEYEIGQGIYSTKMFTSINDARAFVSTLEPDEQRPVIILEAVEAYKAHEPEIYKVEVKDESLDN